MFTGGWDLDAAESVCADDALDRTDILDLLGRLVDKSLVVAEFDTSGDVRYSQLQTLWEYGRERLADTGEAARSSTAMRSGSWPSVSRSRQGMRGRTGPVWQARFAAELGNLRGALDWFIKGGDADRRRSR